MAEALFLRRMVREAASSFGTNSTPQGCRHAIFARVRSVPSLVGHSAQGQPPRRYRLLGIELYEDDSDVIATAADQRMTHLKTFQTGANAAHWPRCSMRHVGADTACSIAHKDRLTTRNCRPDSRPPTLTRNPPTLPRPAHRASKPLAKARPLTAVDPLPIGEPAPIDSLGGIADTHGLAKRGRKAKGRLRPDDDRHLRLGGAGRHSDWSRRPVFGRAQRLAAATRRPRPRQGSERRVG